MKLKRLWDTQHRRIVWAYNPDNKKYYQVWTDNDGSHLYIFNNGKWIEIVPSETSATIGEMGPLFKQLEDETVGYYLTNAPTNLFSWDEGKEVSYRFMNGTTVLDSWKVDEGETPEYTGDTPTKEATAQYTYTFSGWKPTVWPIYKKTDFKAQFTSTVNKYTVSIASNNTDYGTVDKSSVANVEYGTKLSTAENVLTIGEWESATTVTATAETWYHFSSWWTVPATVSWATSITATFEADA